jgi:antitoxin MazE
MLVQVTKWGNSLGVRVPKEIAKRVGLSDGQQVEIAAEGDHIVIRTGRPAYDLATLLVGMTPKAMHAAFDWGPDKGREAIE